MKTVLPQGGIPPVGAVTGACTGTGRVDLRLLVELPLFDEELRGEDHATEEPAGDQRREGPGPNR